MLNKLERAYLGILRVVILIAATCALILAILGLASAVPPLLRWSGLTAAEKPSGGTLRAFIEEQKITETSVSIEDQPIEDPIALPDIKTAAKNVVRYLGNRGTVSEDQLKAGLQRYADGLPGYGEEYAESIKALTDQLLTSKGKPLSQERVGQLIDWHHSRFQADLSARTAAEAEANTKFWVTLGVAGAAFLAFVLIIFVFIFVKIERSLRVVKTSRLEAHTNEDLYA